MYIEKLLPTARKLMCCIDEGTSLLHAAQMLGNNYDMLLVCDEQGRMVGVLTKTDAVRQIGSCTGASCILPVTKAMTREIITASPNGLLKDVWDLMKARGFKNITAVDPDGKQLGVLNARDVLQNLWQEVQHEEDLLFNYVMNVGYR